MVGHAARPRALGRGTAAPAPAAREPVRWAPVIHRARLTLACLLATEAGPRTQCAHAMRAAVWDTGHLPVSARDVVLSCPDSQATPDGWAVLFVVEVTVDAPDRRTAGYQLWPLLDRLRRLVLAHGGTPRRWHLSATAIHRVPPALEHTGLTLPAGA